MVRNITLPRLTLVTSVEISVFPAAAEWGYLLLQAPLYFDILTEHYRFQ